MANNYTASAINLKSYNLGESDKIVVMYSREHGLIRCVAKGVKKPTSKLGGRMQTLVANKLFLAKGKNLDIVCQAEMIDNFKQISKDITKLTYAIYCAELVSVFGLENDINSSQIYDIFFEGLKNISLSSNDDEVLWTVLRFKLLLLEQMGYAVQLNNCVKCNKPVNDDISSFCAHSGGILCSDCENSGIGNHDIDKNIIKLFRDAMFSDFPENTSFDKTLPDDKNKYLVNQLILGYSFKILKEYVALRLHKKLKSPDLIECLC